MCVTIKASEVRGMLLYFLLQIAEWSDNGGLSIVPAKYTRVQSLDGVVSGRTYIVLIILASTIIFFSFLKLL